MSWAAVGSAAIVVGGSYLSNKSASKDAKNAGKLDQAALEFEQQRYDDWKAIYGDLEQNLADFYGNLTPDYFEVAGLEAAEQERTAAMNSIRETFAQRGIGGSGLEAAAIAGQELQTAQERATVRRNAPVQTANEQLRFLQVGLGQNPEESLSQTYAQLANNAQTMANESARVAGQSTAAAVESAGKAATAIADYYRTPGRTT